MEPYLLAKPQIVSLAHFRKVRRLPLPGTLLVQLGDAVRPDQIVARVLVPGEARVLEIAEALGVEKSKAAQLILKSVGETVQEEEVIARRGGLSRRTVKSPLSGTVTAIDEARGLLTVMEPPKPFELEAQVAGKVVELAEDQQVTIEARGALVRGALGMGQGQRGILRPIVGGRELHDEASLHPADTAGIVVLPSCVGFGALQRAAELKVRGVVAASVALQDLCRFAGITEQALWSALSSGASPAFARLPFCLVLTEGFGRAMMPELVLHHLTAHVGQDIVLDLDGGAREPIILLPKAVEGEEEPVEPLLRPGSRVRVIGEPFPGQTAEVVALPAHPLRLEHGALARCAEISLIGKDLHAVVPLSNLALYSG